MKTKNQTRIAFSDQMVRAILAGEKLETRRLPATQWERLKVGDKLLLGEGIKRKTIDGTDFAEYTNQPALVLGLDGLPLKWRWETHAFLIAKYMPLECARFELKVVRVSRERLKMITEAGAEREGFRADKTGSALAAFFAYWDHLHANEKHDTNPMVYAIRFEVEPRHQGAKLKPEGAM